MNPKRKKDYFSEILNYDERISKHVEKSHAIILKEHLNHCNDKYELNNIKSIWTDGIERFNEMIQNKIDQTMNTDRKAATFASNIASISRFNSLNL